MLPVHDVVLVLVDQLISWWWRPRPTGKRQGAAREFVTSADNKKIAQTYPERRALQARHESPFFPFVFFVRAFSRAG
jgi:hypothetical protein